MAKKRAVRERERVPSVVEAVERIAGPAVKAMDGLGCEEFSRRAVELMERLDRVVRREH